MRLSMKTEYGVRAIVELAAIPGPFLDQVLMTLRRAGLVHSTRGPHGGHVLARSPEDIRLDEVIACLEGDGVKRGQPDGAETGDSRVLALVTEKAEQAARDVFASQTLADCLRRSEERRVGKECRSRWSPY